MEAVRACSSQSQHDRNCCQGHDNASSAVIAQPFLYNVLSRLSSLLLIALLLQESGEQGCCGQQVSDLLHEAQTQITMCTAVVCSLR